MRTNPSSIPAKSTDGCLKSVRLALARANSTWGAMSNKDGEPGQARGCRTRITSPTNAQFCPKESTAKTQTLAQPPTHQPRARSRAVQSVPWTKKCSDVCQGSESSLHKNMREVINEHHKGEDHVLGGANSPKLEPVSTVKNWCGSVAVANLALMSATALLDGALREHVLVERAFW